jgi:ferritin-like metal-binding protein YciE
MVDEVVRVDPNTGLALEVRMARGVQAVEELGEIVVVHYVDDDYVMQRLEIPKSEVSASPEIDVEKLKQAITKRIEEMKARRKALEEVEDKVRGFKPEKKVSK